MPMSKSIELTDGKPKSPQADFAFYIDFDKSKGSASRVFKATHDFIKACEKFDKSLLGSIDNSIETVLMIEDIEAASLKTWFRNALNSTDDQALKELNWKPAVGKYLVRAKYAVLRWIDEDDAPKSIPDLRNEIKKLAAETDVRHLPDYAPVSTNSLVDVISDFNGLKDELLESDTASIVSEIAGERSFNLSMRIDVSEIEDLAIRETIENPETVMLLAVKKPDFLGDSQWEFKHGKKTIRAKVADETWLNTFRKREIDVRLGDALRCIVVVAYDYGHDGELLRERFLIVSVQEKIDNQYKQDDLFD